MTLRNLPHSYLFQDPQVSASLWIPRNAGSQGPNRPPNTRATFSFCIRQSVVTCLHKVLLHKIMLVNNAPMKSSEPGLGQVKVR